MKKYLFASCFSICLAGSLIAQNWQALPNAPKSWRNDDIYFLTPQMGWAIHACYEYITPTQLGQVYRTKDGGNTWQLMKDSAKTFFRAVGFADSLTGWIGNLADTSKVNGAPITTDTIPFYQTTDGGHTLTPVNLPNPHPVGICGISVVTDSIIFAYGRWPGPAAYVETTNKGATWTYHDLSTLAYGLVDGWFINKDTGFITGASPAYKAQILSTVDGGATWQVAYRSTRADTDEVWKVFFASRNIAYGAIEYQPNVFTSTARYYIKSTDGGRTWTEHSFISNYDEEGVGFINDTVGWIGGDDYFKTYITYNGGTTWQPDNNFGVLTQPYQGPWSGYSMNRFRKLNDSTMYASGNTVYKLNWTTTGINKLMNTTAAVENYPNPYTSQTTIEYTLTQTCHNVKLEVFAMRGQLIFSRNFGIQEAGKHQFDFTEGIPTGAYYYTVTSDECTVTRKMIKVK